MMELIQSSRFSPCIPKYTPEKGEISTTDLGIQIVQRHSTLNSLLNVPSDITELSLGFRGLQNY